MKLIQVIGVLLQIAINVAALHLNNLYHTRTDSYIRTTQSHSWYKSKVCLSCSSYIFRSYDHCKLSSSSFQSSSAASASEVTRFWLQTHHIAYPHAFRYAYHSERMCSLVCVYVFVYITEEKTTTTDLYVLYAKKDRKKLNCHLVNRPYILYTKHVCKSSSITVSGDCV